jgi:hypothetical protein
MVTQLKTGLKGCSIPVGFIEKGLYSILCDEAGSARVIET